MKTTLSIVLPFFGWQGGTIHQAKHHFANVVDQETRDKVCGAIVDNVKQIQDLENANWFMSSRLEAVGIVPFPLA